MATDKQMSELYEFCDFKAFSDPNKIKTFGEVDVITGEYVFKTCEECRGPLFGHKKCLARENTLLWSDEQVEKIKAYYRGRKSLTYVASNFSTEPP